MDIDEEEFYIVSDAQYIFESYLDESYIDTIKYDKDITDIEILFGNCLFSSYDKRNIIILEKALSNHIEKMKKNYKCSDNLINCHKLIYDYINRINIRINKLNKIKNA